MNKDDQNSKHAIDERYGVKVYQTNPSIPSETEIKRSKRAQIGTDMRGLVVDNGSGEILGHGGAIAYEWEEVDKERFVKLYLAGLKQAAGLSKAGLAVFETVYKQVRERPGQDTVPLDEGEPISVKHKSNVHEEEPGIWASEKEFLLYFLTSISLSILHSTCHAKQGVLCQQEQRNVPHVISGSARALPGHLLVCVRWCKDEEFPAASRGCTLSGRS